MKNTIIIFTLVHQIYKMFLRCRVKAKFITHLPSLGQPAIAGFVKRMEIQASYLSKLITNLYSYSAFNFGRAQSAPR